MNNFNKGLIFAVVVGVLSFWLVTAAGTTLSGNTLSTSLGTIEGVRLMNLENHSLILADTVDGTTIAIFNADAGAIFEIVEGIPIASFPNTSIGFLGNVDNFDNIDDFSRFKETNLNNGSFALAGFQGQNNVNQTFGLGVTSSNFIIGGVDLPNEGVTFSLADGGTTFSNFLDVGFDWFVNKDDSVVSFDFERIAELDEKGNYEIDGNFTGELANLTTFAILGATPVNSNASSILCAPRYEGALAYSSIDQEFYGCRDKSSGAGTDFEWKKLT